MLSYSHWPSFKSQVRIQAAHTAQFSQFQMQGCRSVALPTTVGVSSCQTSPLHHFLVQDQGSWCPALESAN